MKTDLVSFSDHQDAITLIRYTVFSLEQGVDPAIDFDGLDAEALHVVCSDNGTPVGTGRMLDDGHIGRVAVLNEYRSRGAGTGIMTELINTAREKKFIRVYLYAQVNAVPFYDKHGFTVCGRNFMEAGIMHTQMQILFINA
jgi:predicted GNAT family N-acyltransferase